MGSEVKNTSILTSLVFEIPSEKLTESNINLIDGYINFGTNSYREMETPQKNFRQALLKMPLPTSSAPSPHDFLTAYNDLLDKSRTVFSIHQSSRLSSTVNTANMAVKIEGLPIIVFDSMFTGMAGGFIALEAARVANQGANINEVATAARKIQGRVGLFVLAYPQSPMIISKRHPGIEQRAAGKTVMLGMNAGIMEIKDVFDDPLSANRSLIELLKNKVGDSLLTIAISHDWRVEQNLVNNLLSHSQRVNVGKCLWGTESPYFAIHLGKAMRLAYQINDI